MTPVADLSTACIGVTTPCTCTGPRAWQYAQWAWLAKGHSTEVVHSEIQLYIWYMYCMHDGAWPALRQGSQYRS